MAEKLVLVLAVGISLFFCCASVSNAEDCCQSLGILSECHFLCGAKPNKWWSTTTWTCMHRHGASVAMCKLKKAGRKSIDYVKLFGQKFTETIREGFTKLKSNLQDKLSDANKFATATVEELKTVPEDILSAIESAKGMTVKQLKGLATRLKSFTTQNLKKLMETVNIDVIYQSMQDLAKNTWDLGQLRVLAKTAYTKYGNDISKWTGTQLNALGNFIAGITPSDLSKLGATAFDKSVEAMCKARLRLHQKISLLKPAIKRFGNIGTWNSSTLNRLCNIVEALTPDQLLQLGAKEVTDALEKIRILFLSEPQIQALLTKVKENLGDVKTWSTAQIQALGKLMKGLSVSDLKSIDKEKIKALLSKLGDIDWDISQLQKLREKTEEALGLPGNWTSNQIKDAQKILKGFLKSELEKIKDSDLLDNIKNLKSVNWTTDQAIVILEKLKKAVNFGTLDKANILAMANTLDAFASSDIGKFGKAALLAAVPELIIVKTIATPVMRHVIQVFNEQPGNDINLGSFAVALTRVELNEKQIADVLGNLEKLIGVNWDEAQIAELMMKVRNKLGNLNLTDSADKDFPEWGFQNLAKLGQVVLGFTKDELKNFPIRGLEDALTVIGKQTGWRRGQVISLFKRMRDYWRMQNQNITNLSEIDIEILGTFIQGFTLQELKKLPTPSLDVAIRKLGEQTGMPVDKIKSRAYMAVEHFKKISGVDVLDTSNLQSLGNLVVGLSKDALNKISKNAFLSELYNIARKPGMDVEKLKELIRLSKKHFGQSDVGKWLTNHWTQLGPAIKAMDASEIYRINKEAFEGMVDKFGEMDDWTVDQAKVLVSKAKEYWNEKDIGKWTGAQLRRLGSLIKGLDVSEIKRISSKAFNDMIGSCGHYPSLNKETMKALADRAKEVIANNNASNLNFTDVKRLGCVITGLSIADLAKLKLDIDIIAELGKHTGWDTQQLKAIVASVKLFFQKNINDDYFMSLGNLIKGYTPEDIKQIPIKAFKFAAGHFGKIDGLSTDQMKALVAKAKDAWNNDVNQWTPSQISEAGKFLGGLDKSDIPKLTKKGVDLISTDALKKMDANQIQAFTTEQFGSMDTNQINKLSVVQRSLLSAPQASMLNQVQEEDPADPDPWSSCSGATCSRAGQTGLNHFVILAGLVLALMAWRI